MDDEIRIPFRLPGFGVAFRPNAAVACQIILPAQIINFHAAGIQKSAIGKGERICKAAAERYRDLIAFAENFAAAEIAFHHIDCGGYRCKRNGANHVATH